MTEKERKEGGKRVKQIRTFTTIAHKEIALRYFPATCDTSVDDEAVPESDYRPQSKRMLDHRSTRQPVLDGVMLAHSSSQ